mmetsp:Transcript_41314/g.90179  ORF Transcript_41314/g.90179 Transcript_41314/m.90179 type:complete len:209 (-) Transcript_41314:1685-2311(-)
MTPWTPWGRASMTMLRRTLSLKTSWRTRSITTRTRRRTATSTTRRTRRSRMRASLIASLPTSQMGTSGVSSANATMLQAVAAASSAPVSSQMRQSAARMSSRMGPFVATRRSRAVRSAATRLLKAQRSVASQSRRCATLGDAGGAPGDEVGTFLRSSAASVRWQNHAMCQESATSRLSVMCPSRATWPPVSTTASQRSRSPCPPTSSR